MTIRKTKTEQSYKIGSRALETFEQAHTDLIYAAELAEDHAVEHDARVDELVRAADEARTLAAAHRKRADKIGELLGYDAEGVLPD